MAKNIRVLRGTKLLGKQRECGDTLTEEEYFKIPANVRNALVATSVLEVFDDSSGQNTSLERLETRVRRLEEMVESALGIKLDAIESNTGADDTSSKDGASIEDESTIVADSEPSQQLPETRKSSRKSSKSSPSDIRRGVAVMFMDEEGNSVEGKVRSVSKRTGIAKIDDGEYNWEVNIDELTLA